MRACMALGISPRVYEGWSPASVSKARSDASGDVITTTTTQGSFDRLDRLMIEAHMDNEADLHTCGGYLTETSVPDHGYRVTPHQCFRCEAELRWLEKKRPLDEAMDKMKNPWYYPQARVLSMQPIPFPEE